MSLENWKVFPNNDVPSAIFRITPEGVFQYNATHPMFQQYAELAEAARKLINFHNSPKNAQSKGTLNNLMNKLQVCIPSFPSAIQ